MMKEKSKKLLIIGSVLFLCIGITFAYFIAKVTGGATGGATGKATVVADTLDDLQFSVHDSEEIAISLNQFNFTEGGDNQSGTSIATAKLKANSTKNTATYTYYVYFSIYYNDFIYTTDSNIPELILQITDPSGNEVTSLDNLTYYSSITDSDGSTITDSDGNTISGFDVTTVSGLISVASQYEITSNSSTTYNIQDWTFNLIAVNLSTNQVDNQTHVLNGKVIIKQNEYQGDLGVLHYELSEGRDRYQAVEFTTDSSNISLEISAEIEGSEGAADINLTLKNITSEDKFVRIKVYIPDSITDDISYTFAGEGWADGGSDGYMYYDELLASGKSTSEITYELTFPSASYDTELEEFDITFIAEATSPIYADDGNPYTDWDS